MAMADDTPDAHKLPIKMLNDRILVKLEADGVRHQ